MRQRVTLKFSKVSREKKLHNVLNLSRASLGYTILAGLKLFSYFLVSYLPVGIHGFKAEYKGYFQCQT